MAPICAAQGMFLSSANTYCTICILNVLNAVCPLEISLLVKMKEPISALVSKRFFLIRSSYPWENFCECGHLVS